MVVSFGRSWKPTAKFGLLLWLKPASVLLAPWSLAIAKFRIQILLTFRPSISSSSRTLGRKSSSSICWEPSGKPRWKFSRIKETLFHGTLAVSTHDVNRWVRARR
ncbi:hypothetical protein Dimus_034050 [Dionaea muscipula]